MRYYFKNYLHILKKSTMSMCKEYSTRFNKNGTSSGVKSGVDYYTGEAPTFKEMREFLEKFGGGKIDLMLNDKNGIAKLVLNNPARRNAISGRMMVELEEAIGKLETWDFGKGVLVCGAEGNFCSGGDLEFARATGSAEHGHIMATFMHNVLNRLETLPLISVAFINGSGALGGGAEIAVSCDFRLMTQEDNSGIGFVHSKMGITPAWGGCGRLVKLIGSQKALDVLSTAKILNYLEGNDIGLINASVSSLQEAENWLLQRTKAEINVVRTIKSMVINSVYNKEDPQNVERRLFAPLWGGEANKVALEKRLKHRH